MWRVERGSMMAAALTLLVLNSRERTLFLYDTFEGMPRPADRDFKVGNGAPAIERWDRQRVADRNEWNYASLREVRANVLSTGYPEERVRFVKGLVEQTLPETAPARISLLRLDTDFYESTRHGLIRLFSRVAIGGVLIVDDYGNFQGCREAVDEYFAEHPTPILLTPIDEMVRVGVKVSG